MAMSYKHKRSNTADKVPVSGDFADGEILVNTADGKIFVKAGNNVRTIDNTVNNDSNYLRRSQNLNDLPNKATARTNLGLGTAATKATGTASGQVPLNSDLGTAATKNVGTDPGQVPLNSDLGTAATKNVGADPGEIPLNSDLPKPHYEVFTASGTWTKPSGFSDDAVVIVEAWGAGASGGGRNDSSTSNAKYGGGGGEYRRVFLRLADLPETVAVVVGAGGVYPGGAQSPGGEGGESSFGSFLLAEGGQSTGTSGGKSGAGLGGGYRLTGNTDFFDGERSPTGGARYPSDAVSPWAGGGSNCSSGSNHYRGGNSIYGGGGGGDTVGISIYGGNGGSRGNNGQAPGGGGGRRGGAGAFFGEGGRGEVRIWIGG